MKIFRTLLIMAVMIGMAGPGAVFAQPTASPSDVTTITILHTNDFHGQLEASGSNPGGARLAQAIIDNTVSGSTVIVDAGDEMQGSLLSNLNHGAPVIDVFNHIGYEYATFGNHEFDWGQTVLSDRVTQATYKFLSANIVASTDCTSPGWEKPSFVDAPYEIKDFGDVQVGFIGVTTQEVPVITIASATAGLCFVDPAASIEHYYDAMKTAGADAIVVLSHLGYYDGGYGYGIPVYGDQTLASKLNTAGKPVDLIIGGHSHTNLNGTATKVGNTTIGQAYYNGRRLGKATLAIDPAAHTVNVSWTDVPISTAYPENAAIKNLISTYTSDPDYQELINQPIGYTNTDLLRDYNGDSMMADFVDDAIFNYLNNDSELTNDVDIFFNNAGGIRTDWCAKEDPLNPGTWIWSSTPTDCHTGLYTDHDPMLLTYGNMFTILPFGNATVVGTMTGNQIMDVLNQAASLGKGAIQVSGLKYKFFNYKDNINCGSSCPGSWVWGAFDVQVFDKDLQEYVDLDANKSYQVGTNEFLAPAGGDNFSGFKYMTNISYWGDMLNAVNDWVTDNYTETTPYSGPNGDGLLDGRITRDGTDAGGSIVPVTILHHNDSHGNLAYNASKHYAGFTQLATLIGIERSHNPDRNFLFTVGDQIQGDSMMYYFKSAGTGKAADGTPLPPAQSINPIIAIQNYLKYDGMVLGNHEFNFGKDIFSSVFSKAAFPLLGANMSDDGAYGIQKIGVTKEQLNQSTSKIPVYDFLNLTVPSGVVTQPSPIRVGFLGLTNHRVPNYELPSNIPGLHFYDPIATAETIVPEIKDANDAVVALTHIGFTTNPKSVEVDNNVDTYLAATVPDIDVIIGGHSHTDPTKQTDYSGIYKYLPTNVGGPDGNEVLVTTAYRYNYYLGEVWLGFRPSGTGWELVSKAGRYIPVVTSGTITPEDAAVKAIVDPYTEILNIYNSTKIGSTKIPIDALAAFTQETNGANLQADASLYELNQNDITPDFHLSGAMTNSKIAAGATDEAPVDLYISDMFTSMPYENSLVVISMNGPQLKAVLERGYRNYFYYKYIPGYGGYSHYTTCMLDTNAGAQITYNDNYPWLPNGNNVVSLKIGLDQYVDFTDADTYYDVSTVNYLAAGSCNFNDDGVSLWPLSQIVHDTQFYVRDAVIDYIKAQTESIKPVIEGRLVFNLLNQFYFLPLISK